MTDAYKIGITVALTNLVGSELTSMAKQFGIAGKAASDFSIGLGLIGGIMIGVTAAFAAGVNEPRKFQIEVAKFKLFGMGDATNAQAQKFAENMKVVGTSATEAMHLMVEAQGVFRKSGLNDETALRGAKMAAPMLGKIDFIGKTLDGEGASKMHSSAQAMLRFIDMQGGLNDPERFNQIANAGFKAIRSSGGNIDWEQYRQFRARGASAAANLTDEALFGEFEPIIQELKGSTAGFALRTAYNRLNGIIRLPNQAAHELIDVGAWDPSKIVFNSQGGIKSFKGNPLVDSDLFARDPIAYYEKYILPYYNKRGLSAEERTRENALIFGSTGGNLFNIVERQNVAIHRSVESYRKALGIDASVDVAKATVDGKLVDLTAKWATLMKDIGDKLLPAVNAGVGYMDRVLGGIIKAYEGSENETVTSLSAKLAMPGFGRFSIWGLWMRRLRHLPEQRFRSRCKASSMAGSSPESTANHFLNGMGSAPSTGNDYDLRCLAPHAGLRCRTGLLMPIVLTLGSVIFQDFEIPQELPFGGSHMLVVKKLVGGDRVIDAMGRDDAEKAWAGRFRGSQAEARARILDEMRIGGEQQLLTWSSLRFLVVIDKFEFRFSGGPQEIPYSISCTVIQDLSAPIVAVAPTANSLIFGDINSAGTLAGEINVSAIVASVAQVASAANAVAKFSGASPSQVAGVQTTIQTALTATATQQTVLNAAVAPSGSVAGVVGGGAPAALAASLSGQSAAFGQLAQLYQLQALLGRTSINVANAGA